MQVVGQFLGRSVAIRRILAERFKNDDLKLLGYPAIQACAAAAGRG